MTIKSLLMLVFLYVCLVWVGGALYYPDSLREFGLRWTFFGIAAVLLWLVLARIWGWVHVARAKNAARPKIAPKQTLTASLHEDDAALLVLLQEAANSLAKSSNGAPRGSALSSYPIYLLVGPERSGKTSTFVNSGLDPVPLASQAMNSGQYVPTRLSNIWLAKDAVFVELGGRTFSGDVARWASLLHTLRGQRSLPAWRRFFADPDPTLNLQGVIAFCELKEFTATSPQAMEILDRTGRHWRERLGAIADVFGRRLPVYFVTTSTDVAIPYFNDYFGRMRDPEINQILGCSLELLNWESTNVDMSAEAENKRLTQSFGPLLQRLSELRVAQLAHEPDEERKPGIYEFPRELRRLRPAYVQFLVEVFRPHPLRPTLFLRGYYFTGTREEDPAAVSTPLGAPEGRGSDATVFFRSDATQVFTAAEPTKTPAGSGRGAVRRRWVFVSELFLKIILRDQVGQSMPVERNEGLDLRRRIILGATCALCALLVTCFVWSWARNSSLLSSVNSLAGNGATAHTGPPSLADLQSLDELRGRLVELLNYERSGPPLGLRWGLYSGGRLTPAVKDLYFRRFQQLLLNEINAKLIAGLKGLPDSPGANDPYQPVADVVKTHLMISSGSCPADPPFVSRMLRETLSAPSSNDDWRTLADRQIEFYAKELKLGVPVKLNEDGPAVEHARKYLRQIQGIEKIYAALLVETQKALSTKPQRLADIAPNYTQVLRGPADVSPVFTREGSVAFLNVSKNVKSVNSAEVCVTGSSGALEKLDQTIELERALKERYDKEYLAQWQNYVKGFAVLGYSGPVDAARKLFVLADHSSPLLGLLALTSKQTYFAPTPMPAIVQQGKKALNGVKEILSSVKGTAVSPDSPAPDTNNVNPITRAFQPVRAVVPPTSETWITETNKPYVDALADLAASMQQLSTGPTETIDPNLVQAAKQNRDKALAAVRQISNGFDPTGVNGLGASVKAILDAPINQADRFIPSDITRLPAKKLDAEARELCDAIDPVLNKYPFQNSSDEASLGELTRVFAPSSGAVWKFQAKSLAESVLKEGTQWKAKDGAKVPIKPEVTVFLNKAQSISDAFFPGGSNQPRLTYTLRPKLDDNLRGAIIALTVDGQAHEWKSSLQKQFTWPGAPDAEPGARAFLKTDTLSVPFASEGGLWGVFRVMADAEPRLPGTKVIEWKYLRGGAGRREAIQPAPVRLEFVEFPGSVDLFNPHYFEGLRCPRTAAAQ